MIAQSKPSCLPAILTLLCVSSVLGQETRLQFERRQIESSQLPAIIKSGRLIPIARDDFEARVKSAGQNSGPGDSVVVDRIQYDGTLTDLELSGTFLASIPNGKSDPWIFMGPIHFDSIDIGNSPFWGLDADGNAVAKASDTQLRGTWKLKGTKRPWGVEFTVTPLAALASELRLTLPSSARLESDTAIVTAGDLNGTERRYRVVLTGQATSQIRVITEGESQTRPIADIRTNWSLRQSTAQFQTDFNIQTTSSISTFAVGLPEGLAIESMTYGDNVALPMSVSESAEGRVLQVDLPEPIRSSSRRLAVTGRMQFDVGALWSVPSFDNITCGLTSGKQIAPITRRVSHRLFVESPLELQDLNLNGFRQTDSGFQIDGSQTIAVTRLFKSGRVTLRVGESLRSRKYQIVTRVTFDAGVWKQRTLIISDTPLPGEVTLLIPAGLTTLAVNTGSDKTPCNFRLDQTDKQLLRVAMPPTVSSILEIDCQSETPPPNPITITDGAILSTVCVANASLISEPESELTNIPIRELRATFGASLDTDFVSPDDRGIRITDGRLPRWNQPIEEPNAIETVSPDLSPAIPSSEPVVSVSVRSSLQNRPSADTHVATMRTGGAKTFSFELADWAKVRYVDVNGKRSRFERTVNKIEVALDSSQSENEIVVRYDSAAKPEGWLLQRVRRIPIPQPRNCVDFVWNVDVSSNLRYLGSSLFGHAQNTEHTSNLLGPFATRQAPEMRSKNELPYVPAELEVIIASRSTQQYAWIALMTATLAGLFLARYRKLWPLALCAAAMVTVSLMLPHETGVVCGGAAIGFFIAIAVANVVPVQNPKLRDTKVDTSNSAAVVTAGLLALLFVSPASVSAISQQNENRFRVYEIADQETLYVDRGLLDQLDKNARSDASNLLVRNTRYVVSFDSGSFSIRANINAVARDPSQPAIRRFPFAAANVSRCRVNGKTVDFTRKGNDVVLSLPPVDSESTEPSRIDIEFDLYPPTDGSQCSLALVSAPESTCRIESDHTGQIRLNGQLVERNAEIPVKDNIAILANAGRNEPSEPTKPVFETSCTVEPDATETNVEFKVVATPGLKPLTELSLQFPSTLRFVSLNSAVTARPTIVSGSKHNHARIVFDEPVLAPIELRLKLTATNSAGQKQQTLDLEPPLPGPLQVSVQRNPALTLTKLRWIANEPMPIRVAGDEPINFRTEEPGVLEFELEATPTVRNLRLTQTIQIKADRLDYKGNAEIQVLNGPVFAHTVIANPNLQIESISVRENGVDRLARYQRSGDRVLLLLEGRTSGTQNIIIEGHLPMQTDTESDLPSISVVNTKFQQSTLTLQRDAEVEAELLDKDGIPFAVRPNAPLTGSLETGEVTFELLESSHLPRVRARRSKPISVTGVCLMNMTDDKPSGWTWQYRVEHSGDDTLTFDAKGGHLQTTTPRRELGNQTTLSLGENATRIVTFAIEFAEPTESIPDPTFDKSVEIKRILAIPKLPEFVVTNAGETMAVTTSPKRRQGVQTLQFYDLPADSSEIRIIARSRTVNDAVAIRHLETRLWEQEDQIAGTTSIALPEPTGNVNVHLPESVSVFGAEIDGLQVESQRTGSMIVVPSQPGKILTLRWTCPINDGRFSTPSPDVSNGEALFTFHSRTGDSELQAEGLLPLTVDEFLANQRIKLPEPEQAATLLLSQVSTPARVGQNLLIVNTNTQAPADGFAMISGLVALLSCLASRYMRTRTKVLLLSGIFTVAALTIGDSMALAGGFLAPGLVAWWLIPRRM